MLEQGLSLCLLHWGADVEYNNSTFNLPIYFKTSKSRTIKLQNMGCEINFVIGSPIIYCAIARGRSPISYQTSAPQN